MSRLAILALVLACGGWVCHSDADDPCPGAVTCAVDVGTTCCPFGEAVWCGSCAVDASGCLDATYTCKDESRILDCSFDATFDALTCDRVGLGIYHVVARGTLSGCGQEVVEFELADPADASVDCGAWEQGVFGGCTPQEDATSTTTWSLDTRISLPPGAGGALTLVRGHGSQPTIATTALPCVEVP